MNKKKRHKYLKSKSFWTIIVSSIIILFLFATFFFKAIEQKPAIFASFLVGDITLVTLFFGVLAPMIKNKESGEAFSYVLNNKIYDKKIITMIAATPLLHLVSLILSIYHNSFFLLIYSSIITTLIIMIVLWHIYTTITYFSFQTFSTKRINKFYKMVSKDVIKSKISLKRKGKYVKLVNEIFVGMPRTKQEISAIGVHTEYFIEEIFIFYSNISSKFDFLYSRFSLFKAHQYNMGMKYLKNNPLEISVESNGLLTLFEERMLYIFNNIENRYIDKLMTEMTRQYKLERIPMNSGSMLNVIRLISNVSTGKLESKRIFVLILFSNFLMISDISRFTGEIKNIKIAKRIVINTNYINEKPFKLLNQIKRDATYIKGVSFNPILAELIIQATFQPIRIFRIAKSEIKNLFKDKITPLVTMNIINLREQLENIVSKTKANKKLDEETKYEWINQFIRYLKSLEKEKGHIYHSDLDMEKNSEASEHIYSFIRNQLLQKNNFEYATDNLFGFFKKIEWFLVESFNDELNDAVLYNGNKGYFNTFVHAPIFGEYMEFARAALATYQINSEEFKLVVESVLYVKKIAGRNFRRKMDLDLAPIINEVYNLNKQNELDHFAQKEWFDISRIKETNGVETLMKEKREYEKNK